MTHRTFSLPLVLALLVLSPAVAYAQDDPRKAQAEAVFAEGIKLHDAGKNAEALAKYQKAYEIFPTPNILFATARIEQLLGRSLVALRHYREALKSPLLHPANRDLGKKFVPELEVGLAKLDVKAPAGAIFSVDGKRFMTPLDEAIDVEPGAITVEASVGGNRYTGSVTTQRGARVELELRSVEGPLTEPPHETESPSFWTTGNTVGVVLTGVAIVGVAGFVGLRVAASSKADDADAAAKDPSAQGGCDGVSSPACDRARSSARSERDLTNASTGFLIGGLVSGAVAAGFFLFSSKPTRASHGVTVTPAVSTTSNGVLIQGRF